MRSNLSLRRQSNESQVKEIRNALFKYSVQLDIVVVGKLNPSQT